MDYYKPLLLIEAYTLIVIGYAQLLSQVRVGVDRKDTQSCGMEVVLVVATLSCWCCFLHLNGPGVNDGGLFIFV